MSVAAALFLASCVSAEKRYAQGLQLEERGRSADAAARYVAALKKDPALSEALLRLRDTGDRAVAEAMASSATATATGRADAAADLLLELDRLHRDARTVGVELALPPRYPLLRREALDAAIEDAIRDGMEPERGWRPALDRLEGASQRYQPSPEQRERIVHVRSHAYLGWAEAAARDGDFRAAYDRAGRAMALRPMDDSVTERAERLRLDVVERYAVHVAVLPLAATERARDSLPRGALRELQVIAAGQEWRGDDPFVEVIGRREVERVFSRTGRSRRAVSTAEAAQLGRALGADVVVVTEVDSVARRESVVRQTRHPARTRSGVDTAFVVRQGEESVELRVSYALVDVAARRTREDDSVTARASGRFRRAEYRGNPGELDLPRREREWFDPDSTEDERETSGPRIAVEISRRLAGEVLPRLRRWTD